MPPLDNARREMFCQEYLVDLNASRAAERAKYSPRTCGSQGHRLLKNAQVMARIKELQVEREQRIEYDAEWVIGELGDNAEKAKDAKQYNASNQAIIAIGKHHGMFVERVEQSGPGGGPMEHRQVEAMTTDERRRRVLRLLSTASTEAA